MRINRLIVAALLLAAAPAYAQKTPAVIAAENNANIHANGGGAITGPILNSLLGDIITSYGGLLSPNAWTGMQTFNGGIVSNPTGLTNGIFVTNTPGNTVKSTAGYVFLNELYTADDSTYYTDPHAAGQNVMLYIEQKKNDSNNGLGGNHTVNGGMDTLFVRGYVRHPMVANTHNRNYVGGQFEIRTDYGDGGVATTATANQTTSDSSIQVASITQAVGDGTTGKIVADQEDLIYIVDQTTGKWQALVINGVSGTGPYTLTFTSTLKAPVTTGDAVYSYKGGFFAQGVAAYPSAGAANMLELAGTEYDTLLPTGASALIKSAITIGQVTGDAVHGTIIDAGILFGNNNGTPGWRSGILFSAFKNASGFPISSDGCIICADTKGIQSTIPNVLTGIDFSAINITGDFLNSQHFSVTGSGITNTKSMITSPLVTQGLTAIAGTTPDFQTIGTGVPSNSPYFGAWNATGAIGRQIYSISRAASPATHTAVAANDAYSLNFYGDDGTAMTRYAAITSFATGTISSGVVPGYMTFGAANNSGVMTTILTMNGTNSSSIFSGVVNAQGGFQANGVAGITKACSAMPTSVTITNGIITALAGGTCV